VLLTCCGSLSIASQILAPSKQQNSLGCIPGQKMGASVPLSRESTTTSTRHFLLQFLVCVGDVVSLYKSCSLALSTAKASYLLLLDTYEERD